MKSARFLPINGRLEWSFKIMSLFPHLSVYDNVAYGLKARKVPKKEMDQESGNVWKVYGFRIMQNECRISFPEDSSNGWQLRELLQSARPFF